ncbi:MULTISPECIES: esterase/lipase family protein [Streptomyces]|uniref:Alpha/beta fold hydrolase n=2 Tax=Streptomyces rimosus subsp. rimosus TaxID=132474 RepID=L8EM26_STRR1|nr:MULTISPECIES: alpha/beta fold hydrolase [Streptomyces]KOG76797.1 lipase [Kitasatospora aureofaciens]MYT47705.1 alpha/beta fold hydrolase [Streptomyces sp. SID5471]KEF07404.1 lipase [Streptomyces rimosus]KEF19720.1 lipase [Streptomyces rimosus]KOT36409.1 lipase [Streptomyces sp. NRRL WC-3701]
MKALPFLCCLARPSALLRATVVELAILVGHLLLYPTGIQQEQPRALPGTPAGPDPEHDAGGADAIDTGTGTAAGTVPAARTALLPTEGRAHPPVLLLHGFIDNRSVFVLLRRSLLRHGWRHVEALNYSPLTCDLRKAAELLGRHVEQVCERTGHSRVDLVGHSLGGLIARYYAQRLGGDLRVRTLVTLGTPHGGTRVAPLMSAHPLVRQMRPHSDVIVELARPAPNCRTHFVSFWSDLDQLMVPVETARIDHRDLITRSVRVSGVGHLALPVNGAVAAGIREALGAEEEAEGSVSTTSVA